MSGAAVVVDARGLRCPLPVIRLARAADGAAPGTLLQVLATDPAAEHDVPAWARMRGHRVVGSERDGDTLRITVELGPPAAARS
ncbi:sulfurtransferase TusA family protein [Angustibacter sp. Root456]|uniref:sulfurtransferase TusA family protein n=1 Tax=Angustibacter sp. Root456 TaxID=1736539 RepID=UPI0006F1CDAE|nr:sulfurtransferase TusA family protein [Angustibacter sp. Root456]KQX64455.1 hypothetical protein ASD06_09805 [Angustibacter sp. Root456]